MAEVIVALDLPEAGQALTLIDRLPGLRWVKIGPMLFLDGGPGLIRELTARDLRVFLDLKWHDIPHSVAQAVQRAAALGVSLATVHALGGQAMLAAAVEASRADSGAGADGATMRLAAVTVLTSHRPVEYWDAIGCADGATRSGGFGEEAARLGRLAVGAGVHALVTSAAECALVRAAVGTEPWIVVPGIRPSGAAQDDQARVAEPAEAVRAGASHLVVGRPITRAKNPLAVYESICEDVS